MSKALRYLRIAFSVTRLLVAVFLCALWVRSNDYAYFFPEQLSKAPCFQLRSFAGADDVLRWRSSNVNPWIRQPILRIQIPHPLITTTLIAAAFLPWLPWSNRFRLRTLLIGTTLIAVVMGLVVWAVR